MMKFIYFLTSVFDILMPTQYACINLISIISFVYAATAPRPLLPTLWLTNRKPSRFPAFHLFFHGNSIIVNREHDRVEFSREK